MGDKATTRLAWLRDRLLKPGPPQLGLGWRLAVGPVAVVAVLLVQLGVLPDPSVAPFVFCFVGVALASWLGGRVAGFVAVALSAAVANYAFVDGPWAWATSSAALGATFLYVVSSTIVVLLSASLRDAAGRAQDAARALQTILDVAPAAIWIARDPRGDRIDSNRVGAELLGRPPGTNVSVTAPPDERPANFRVVRDGVEVAPEDLPIQAAARRGAMVEGSEFDLVFEDGRVLHLLGNAAPLRDERGFVHGSVGAFIDISDRRRAEEALIRSEARFVQLAESLPGMVFEIDREGRTTYMSENWHRFTGRPPGDVESRLELVHPDDRDRVRATWQEAVRSGAPYECECRFPFNDGRYRWLLVRATPFRDADGTVTRWVGTATDIDELRRTQELLREADRRKTEFLAVLSHELRNPLTPITNSLYVLDRAVPGGEQARRAQEVIGRQVSQLARMVDDLLEVTRISRGLVQLQVERLELNDVVRRTIEDHRSLFETAGISLVFEAAAGPVVVDADKNRMAQIIGNLLANAAKFTPHGGRVGARVETDAESRQAILHVTDDGAGISPELLARLFKPLTQADRSLDRHRGGLGLGLTLVKGFVEQHGGTIAAESAGDGLGSEFTIRLPLARHPRLDDVPKPAARPPAQCRVLIIEDNVDAAESLRELLELEGQCVAVAYDGPAGLARAREFRPELVLCDIGLPGMDGFEVARAFRKDVSLEGVSLVALTGYALPEDLELAAEAGFDRHLAKPPGLEELREVLATVRKP